MQSISASDSIDLMPLGLRDGDELFELIDRNRLYLRQWLPWLNNVTRSDDTRAFIRAAQSQASQNNGAQLAICFDGRIIGVIGHHQIDWRNRLTSLGYWVGQEFQGKGLVTTATRALVGHAFDEVHLNRVEIRCAVDNRKSQAIPIRLGFRQEGQLRDAEWLYDHFVDHFVYGMLKDEWHNMPEGHHKFIKSESR